MPYANPLDKKEYDRQYKQQNPEGIKRAMQKYCQSHREHLRQVSAEYRKNNLEACNKRISDWAKKYPEKKNAKEAKRRADVLHRLPLWANLETIKAFYKLCPIGYHVDHIVPLKGRNVSGLHVIENLQYLLASDNLKKHNVFIT